MANQWFTLKRNATIHHAVPIFKGIVTNLYDELGVSFKRIVVISKKNEQTGFNYLVQGTDAVADFMLKKTPLKGFHDKIDRQWKRYADALERLFKKLDATPLSRWSLQELISIYKNLIFNLEQENAFGTLSDFLSSDRIKDVMSDSITKLKIHNAHHDDLLRIAMSSIYDSPYNKEHRDFLKIVAMAKRGADITKALDRHAQEFWYIQNDYKTSVKLTSDFFRTLVASSINEGINPDHELRSIKEKASEIIATKRMFARRARTKRYNRLAALLHMTDIHVKLWDLKKVMMQKSFYYLDQLLMELAQREGQPFDDLKWLMPTEVMSLVDNKPDKQIIKTIEQRKQCCVLVITKHNEEVLLGPKARKLIRDIEGPVLRAMSFVKGQTGSVGAVKGTARIVLDPHGDVQFNKGDILVTGMTTPDFIPLMRRASAFVTDDGGITCHAAIIAREMKKPCVIGTKVATKVFKNGDTINVDADHGLVQRVS